MIQDKYNLIADHLEQRIANGEFEHRLPPCRQLVLEYSVSKRTLGKALKRIKTAGFILPGARGTYLNPERRPRKRVNTIAVICEKKVIKNQNCEYSLQLMRDLAESAGFNLQTLESSEAENFPADGFIFFDYYNYKLAERLYRNGFAAVSLNSQASNSPLSYVDLSYSEALIRAINALIRKGITRIAFYHPMSNSADSFANWKKLYTEFIQERRAFMLNLPELDFFIPHFSNNGLDFIDFLRRQKTFPQVILQLNWHSELESALLDRNIIPGTDCTLMSLLINKPIIERWVKSAWELLIERMRNAYAPPIYKNLPVENDFFTCNDFNDFNNKLNNNEL